MLYTGRLFLLSMKIKPQCIIMSNLTVYKYYINDKSWVFLVCYLTKQKDLSEILEIHTSCHGFGKK